MVPSGVDQWSLKLPLSRASPAHLQVKCLVDDSVWQIGPNTDLDLQPLWAANASVTAAATASITPGFFVKSGTVQLHALSAAYSPELQNVREVSAYLPPAYVENKYAVFPVLIMHDGQNLFAANESAFGTAWMIQDTMDTLIAEGDMQQVVVVGVANVGANRTYEYTYDVDPTVHDGGGADAYLDFLELNLYPWIQATYRVQPLVPGVGPSASRWSMIGSSLGGLLSCYAGWTRPNIYGKVGCMSSSFWWNNESFNNTILETPPSVGPPHPDVVFYLDSGNAGPDNDDVVQTTTVFKHLLADGYTRNETVFHYVQPGGQHNEYYWGKRFDVPCKALFPPAAQAVLPMHTGDYVHA